MHEEMVGRIPSLLAKRAKPTIIPTPLLQMVRRPNPILEGKPSKNLYLGGVQALHTVWYKMEVVAPNKL
jgi:hypothetical protein